MNRADISNLDEIYKELGYKPCRKAWIKTYTKSNECCGLSALMLKETSNFPSFVDGNSDFKEIAKYVSEKLNVTIEYITGFIHGFDKLSEYGDSEEYKVGHQDGKEAWNKISYLVGC